MFDFITYIIYIYRKGMLLFVKATTLYIYFCILLILWRIFIVNIDLIIKILAAIVMIGIFVKIFKVFSNIIFRISLIALVILVYLTYF